MSSPNAPPPPPAPPAIAPTIAQSQDVNTQTALATQRMNMSGQTGPFGSMNFVADSSQPSGYRLNTSLNPQEQSIYDVNAGNRLSAGQAADTAISNLRSTLSTPFKLDNAASEGRIDQLASARLDPILAARRQAKETQLYNQGAQPGTPAWDLAMQQLGRDENDAHNQLLLTGRGQANSELLAERNQPFSELGSIFGYGTPNTPTFQQTPTTQIANTNVGDITNQGYGNQMQQYQAGTILPWQAEQQYKQALMGGAFGLGGAAAGGWAKGGFPTPKFG